MDNIVNTTWWSELCRAIKHKPHQPIQCVSIASSSPMSLWECPICHYTFLALREIGYTCCGGFPIRYRPDTDLLFGSRDNNMSEVLQNLELYASYSKETGSPEALAYHLEGISNNSWR